MVSLGSIERIKNKLVKELPGAKDKLDIVYTLTKLVALKVKKGKLTKDDIDNLPLPLTYKFNLNKLIETKDPEVANKIIITYRNKALDGLDELKSLGGGNPLVNWKIKSARKQIVRLSHNDAARIDIYTGFMVVCLTHIIKHIIGVVNRVVTNEPSQSTATAIIKTATFIAASATLVYIINKKRSEQWA